MKVPKSDEHLLCDFVAGRTAALGELARRHEQHLLGLAVGMLGGREDLARDAVQETWVRVIRFAGGFNGRASVKTWLYRIAINRCRDLAAIAAREGGKGEFRAEAQRSQREDENNSNNSDDSHNSASTAPLRETSSREGRGPPNEPAPHDRAVTKERHDRLRAAVESLGPDKRDVLLVCYHQGLTHAEAAEVLDIPIGTLKSRLNAALNELRARLPAE